MSLPPLPPDPIAELPGEYGLLEESSPQGTQKEIKKMASERKSKKKPAETHSVASVHRVMLHGKPNPMNLKRKLPSEGLIDSEENNSKDRSNVSLASDIKTCSENNTTDSLHAYPKRLRRQKKFFFNSVTPTKTNQLKGDSVRPEIIANVKTENLDEISPIKDVSVYPAVASEKKGKKSNKRKISTGKNASKTVSCATLFRDEVNNPSEKPFFLRNNPSKPLQSITGKVTKKGVASKLPDQQINAGQSVETIRAPEEPGIVIIPQALPKSKRKVGKKVDFLSGKAPKKKKGDSKMPVLQEEQNTAAVIEKSMKRKQKKHLNPIQVSGEQIESTPCLDENEIVVSRYFNEISQEVPPNAMKTTTRKARSQPSKNKRKTSMHKKPAVKKVKWQNPNPPTVVKLKIKPPVHQYQVSKEVPVSSEVPVMLESLVKPLECTQEIKLPTEECEISVVSKNNTAKPLVKSRKKYIPKKKNVQVSTDISVRPDDSVEPQESTHDMEVQTEDCEVAVLSKKRTTRTLVKSRKKYVPKNKDVRISIDNPVVLDGSIDPQECTQKLEVPTEDCEVAVLSKKPTVRVKSRKKYTPKNKNFPITNNLLEPPERNQKIEVPTLQSKIFIPVKPLVKTKTKNEPSKENVDQPKCAQEIGDTTVQWKVDVFTKNHTTKLVKTKSKNKVKQKCVPVSPDIPRDVSVDPRKCTQEIGDTALQLKVAFSTKKHTAKSVVKAKIKRNAKAPKLKIKKRPEKSHTANNGPTILDPAIFDNPSCNYFSHRLPGLNSTSTDREKKSDGRSPSTSSSCNLPHPLPIPTVVLHRLRNGDYQATRKILTPDQTLSSSSDSTSSSGTSTSSSTAQSTDNGSDLVRYLGLELSSSSSMFSGEQCNESLIKDICLFYEKSNWNKYFLNFDYVTAVEQQCSGNSIEPTSSKSGHAPDNGRADSNFEAENSVHSFPNDIARLQTSDKYQPMPKDFVFTQSPTINTSGEPTISDNIKLHRHFDNDTSSSDRTTRNNPVTPSESNKTSKHGSNETNSLPKNSVHLTEENHKTSGNEEEVDLDTISLHADSYESFENSPNSYHPSDTVTNTTAASLSKVSSNQNNPEPIVIETTKPVDAEPSLIKFTCEKQNADSTSLLLGNSVPINSESTSDYSKSDNNLNSEDEPPVKRSLPEIPTIQTPTSGEPGFNDTPKFMFCGNQGRTKVFKQVCRYHLNSNCIQDDCNNVHISLSDHLQQIRKNDDLKKPYNFTREYMYLRHFFSHKPCFRSYLEVFMEHAVAKGWYKFLLEIIRDGVNFLEKPQAIVEKALHALNGCTLHNLKKYSDMMGYEIKKNGPRMIHYLFSVISKSLHFLKYKTTLINLLSIAYENNEKMELETAIDIIEQVCSLSAKDLLGEIYSKVLKNTSIAIFSLKQLMQRFNNVLLDAAKENQDFRSLVREFDELMKHSAKPPEQSPSIYENRVNTNSLPTEYLFGNAVGMQESTNTIRTSPDTTQYHDFASNTPDCHQGLRAAPFHPPQNAFPRPPYNAAPRQSYPMHNLEGPMRNPRGPAQHRPWGPRAPCSRSTPFQRWGNRVQPPVWCRNEGPRQSFQNRRPF